MGIRADPLMPRILTCRQSLPETYPMPVLAIPYPGIEPVALPLGPFSIKWYGLAYIAGLLLGWLYIKRLLGQSELWPRAAAPFAQRDTDDLLIYVAAGVLIGGRLGHVLFYEP